MMTPGLRIADGIRAAMHREEYDRIERVNFSTLKLMARTPAHYRAGLVEPPEDTDAKKVGRVLHLAVFEPQRFQAAVAVWDGGVRRGKDWDAFCRKNEGRELLTANEADLCSDVQTSVRNNAMAAPYLHDGRGEVTMFWTARGIECKGRIDFDAADALVDLKSTKDASEQGFARQVFALNYHVQAAWYQDAYKAVTGILKPYKIVAVEKALQYEVQVYRLPDLALDIGRATYLRWLDRLAECRERARWPGYSDPPGELELPIPAWVLPAADDPTGLGLEFGAEE